ncbi:uncharacterized protein B0P05DRAFT_520926 [Gilbertella persicaria]|uniref:uncharacterized protein n=1 Tax=Gilbertella persicaria TaxID=101096 RepID=UPI002220EA19|nr:uncharacterized protein B0P05DRAFT_520926 [Gilbertella persicaria]KAI8098214.1 hypothetical protein B0P05DRAFT_520926 [Gilbertella persicaria]
MLCNTQDAQDAPQKKKSFIHPHDPYVEQEYEALIRAWKNQLIEHTPSSHNNDYIRFAWLRLMDHYLDQQWLDSKQMLQCAQAWSARDSLSLTEAVHTMNILSLKLMQRSLNARQEMLQALGDPGFMVSFGMPSNERFSLSGTEEDEDEDEEVHAPLLMKHQMHSTAEQDQDEAIVTTPIVPESTVENETLRARRMTLLLEQPLHLSATRRSRIGSSSSTPDMPTSQKEMVHRLNRKYESYYQQLYHSTPHLWKGDNQQQEFSDASSVFTSVHSETSSPILPSGAQWKSWFLGNDTRPPPPLAPSLSSPPIVVVSRDKQEEEEQPTVFANEKVQTDDSFANMYSRESKKVSKQPFLMARSESSITAFRPISNNLAPRCQPFSNYYSSSNNSVPEASYSTSAIQNDKIKITKSKSFPSKPTFTSKIPTRSSPPPLPPHKDQPQRNHFIVRVRKKVSLSKLFNSKKPSSSSSSSSR